MVRSATATVDEPRFERKVRALAAEVSAAGAEQVTTFYDSGERRLVSGDRDATGMLVALGRDAEDDIEDVVDAVRAADGRDGFEVGDHRRAHAGRGLRHAGGRGSAQRRAGLRSAGGVDRAVDRVRVGGRGAGAVAVGDRSRSRSRSRCSRWSGQVFPLSVFATNMLTGMGLALGIDYSLFVLSRFREERASRARAAGGDRRGRRDGQPGGAVQRDRLHAGDGRAAVGAEHDHAQPGRGGDRRRGGLGGRRPDVVAGAAERARGSRQRPAPAGVRAGRRAGGEPVLVGRWWAGCCGGR